MTDQTLNLDDIMTRIAKIRTLATRGGTRHEAEVASAKMAELLLRYNLSMADIDTHAQETKRSVVSDAFDFRTSRWQQTLLFVVAEAHLCRALRYTKFEPRRYHVRVMVVGHDHNLIVVRETWAWLQTEIDRLGKAAVNRAINDGDWMAEENRASWLTAFRRGAVDGIYDSYAAMKRSLRAEVGAKWALVPILESEVAQVYEGMFPKRGQMPRSPSVDPIAYQEGVAAGRAVNLGRQVRSGAENLELAS